MAQVGIIRLKLKLSLLIQERDAVRSHYRGGATHFVVILLALGHSDDPFDKFGYTLTRCSH